MSCNQRMSLNDNIPQALLATRRTMCCVACTIYRIRAARILQLSIMGDSRPMRLLSRGASSWALQPKCGSEMLKANDFRASVLSSGFDLGVILGILCLNLAGGLRQLGHTHTHRHAHKQHIDHQRLLDFLRCKRHELRALRCRDHHEHCCSLPNMMPSRWVV